MPRDSKESAKKEGNPAAGASGPDVAAALMEDMVSANHILFKEGVVDGFGHVSARHDQRADRFLLARSMAPALVTAADILEFDLDGEPVAAKGRAVYLERFIHSEIYRVRPDVMAVVHSHSQSVVPFGVVTGVPLRAVFHMGGFLGAAVPIFEIRDTAGSGTDLLVRNRALGAALAQSLGADSAVLMRGHGSTVVAPTLRQAVYRAIYAEVNARVQSEAMRLGPVTYLTPEESRAAAAVNDLNVDRAWGLWKMRVTGDGNAKS